MATRLNDNQKRIKSKTKALDTALRKIKDEYLYNHNKPEIKGIDWEEVRQGIGLIQDGRSKIFMALGLNGFGGEIKE